MLQIWTEFCEEHVPRLACIAKAFCVARCPHNSAAGISSGGASRPAKTCLGFETVGRQLLEGRSVCEEDAFEMQITPGSRPIKPEDIDQAELLIAEGLAMMEGNQPNPVM